MLGECHVRMSHKHQFLRLRFPVPISIVLMGVWKSFRQEFEVYMVDFRKHQKRVEKEAGLAHMIESARRREIEKANRALEQQNAKIDRRHTLLTSLNTVDYYAKHRYISGLCHPGTNDWIQSSPLYRSWFDSNQSGCLCCYGIPGSGKSVLASSVANTIAQSLDASTILCFYYFDYADAKSLDMVCLMAGLIKQILVRMPLDTFDETFDYTLRPHAILSLKEQEDLILHLLGKFSKCYLVLDGLDELNRNAQAAILSLIHRLQNSTKPIIKILVTSRIEEHLIRKELHVYPSLELSSTTLHDDIQLFVQETVQSMALDNPKLSDPTLSNDVTRALVEGANGM